MLDDNLVNILSAGYGRCPVCNSEDIIGGVDRVCFACKDDLAETIEDGEEFAVCQECDKPISERWEHEANLCSECIQTFDLREIERTEHPDTKAGEGKGI